MSFVQTRPVVPTDLRLGYDKRLMLVSGRANRELAAKIGSKLGVQLGGMTLKTFANGEIYCRYEESVRGADVFIVQPTCANADESLTTGEEFRGPVVNANGVIAFSACSTLRWPSTMAPPNAGSK